MKLKVKLPMKNQLILILISFLSLNALSQEDSTTIPFVAYWWIGDTYIYDVQKIQQQWKDDELTKEQIQEYTTTFSVIDSTEHSYTISWEYELDIVGAYNVPNEYLESFSKIKELEIIYKTTEFGDFTEIVNWKEIGLLMNGLFDEMIDLIGKDHPEKLDDVKSFLRPIKQLFSSKQGVEQLVMKELQYFHYLMGNEYDLAEPMLFEQEIPNLFEGEPIIGQGKLWLEEVDLEKAYCIVHEEVTLDPEDTKKLILQMLKKFDLNSEDFEKALKTAVFEIKDNNNFEYFYDPGIPIKIEAIREIQIDIQDENVMRIDKTIIELIDEE